MKNLTVILRTSLMIALSAALAAVSYGQNRERFGISAKAGGVNSVIGRVQVKRAGQSSSEDLSAKDDLTSGDVVTTKGGSRVEVLLNPGSYLRLTENSEFDLSDSSLNNLQLKLIKGSAIVEATGTDDLRLQIRIVTDQSRFTIVRRGVYRINVLPGSTELLVQKGRVLVDGQLGMVKGGTKVTFSNGASFTAKLTKKDRDGFDDWSKERGEFLARANERLSIRTLNSYLFDSGWDSGFYSSSRFGLWTYSPFAGGFTFFPFHYGWSSPYGHHYGRCGWLEYGFGGGNGYFGPIIVGNPPGGWGGSGGSSGGWGSGGSTGGSGGPTVGSGGSAGTPTRVAPSQPSQAGPAAPDPGGRPRTRDPL
ncbi:MAG: hypothetical protein DMF75_22130 [Acidobacteria bacterium]|nr:MAG: hypothetical protein DMF75_22130 [Acidobacteriota bacterium]